ncbi:MAG: hypothetical protein ACPG49_14230, partial [Chitinophagales bacterium]
TIAVGSDADKETLKKIASTETDKVKYALTVTDSTIEMDSAFTHIVQEMGVSTVHVNEAVKIASGQTISHIRPSQDFVIPEGATEAYAAFVWDNYNTYKWVGFESPNYPFPSADGDISFGITKYTKGAQHGIAVAKTDKSVLQNKAGYVVVKLSNVVAGERYEFSLFKRTKDDKHLNFSVSFYTPYNPNANPVTTQEPAPPVPQTKEKTATVNPPQEETTPSAEKMMKSFTGMNTRMYKMLSSEGIRTPEDILRMYDNGGMDKLLHFLENNGVPGKYLHMMHETWHQQAEMMMAHDFENLKHYQADIRQQYSM